MLIHGLQKMTLLDFPGKLACTVFLGGCDFRCPFCHNSELLDGSAPAVMDDAELLAFLKKRQGMLEGVAITGGEPLLRPDLPDLLRAIRDLGYPVKLDTNGSHPERLAALLEEKLADYVAMDIKNAPDRYPETCGLEKMDLTPIRESARLLMNGDTDHEFRTTVVHPLHDDDSFRAIAKWIGGAKRYFLQPFTDRDTVVFKGLSAPSDEELDRWLEILRPVIPAAAVRGR